MFRRILPSSSVPRCSLCYFSSYIPSRSVFVHNLSFDVKSEALEKHMRKAGGVISAVINMKTRKKSKGTAVVTFETESDAANAISMLHGSKLYGREVQMREDRGESLEAEFGKNGQQSKAGQQEGNGARAVYVGNLNTNVTSDILKTHMESMGPVVKATILRGSLGDSQGCGVVVFRRAEDASRALSELYNSILNGRLMFIREDREATSGTKMTGKMYGGPTVPQKGTCVLLGNMDTKGGDVEGRVRAVMEKVGPLKRVRLGQGAQLIGKGRGKILVEYHSRDSALAAVESLHGIEVGPRKITVQKYGN